MRKTGFIAAMLLALALLAMPASAATLDISTLTPTTLPASEEAQVTPMYCGPTQGFYRHGEDVLDTGKPFVYFGQYDCWAMVASGTTEDMGAVGWIESAAALLPNEPQLAFEDALMATVEEDSYLTDEPTAEEPLHLFEVARGTQVTVLAQYEGFAYVQHEIDGVPIRAFMPAQAIQ